MSFRVFLSLITKLLYAFLTFIARLFDKFVMIIAHSSYHSVIRITAKDIGEHIVLIPQDGIRVPQKVK